MTRRPAAPALGLTILTALSVPAFGERLAVYTYTVADGLAGDQVTAIVQDHQGFLWIGTATGLSRFDGVGFRSFGTGDGLPHAGVWSVFESSDGNLWVGTSGGLVRMLPERSAEGLAFEPVPGISRGVTAIAEDPAAGLWVASGGSLFRCRLPLDRPCAAVGTGIRWPRAAGRSTEALLADSDGSLWIGTSVGLYRMTADGPAVRVDVPIGDPPARARDLLVDRSGSIWVSSIGVRRFKLDRTALPHVSVSELVRPALGDPTDRAAAFDLDEGPDGSIWVATHRGLAVVSGETVKVHDRDTGLVTEHLTAVLVDDAGNAWIGTESHGLMRVNGAGFTSFVESDGLVSPRMASVTLSPAGEIVAIAQPPEDMIHLAEGDRFIPIEIPLPELGPRNGWGMNQVTFFDHEGKLWVPSPYGLFRFPAVDDPRQLPTVSHEARYLPDNEIFRLFEDSRGDLWLGAFGSSRLIRWQRATDTMHHYGPADGLPFQAGTAFAEDPSGAVWIGFYTGGLARWRNGDFDLFDHEDGIPGGMVNCLLSDSRGRLWVGAVSGGLRVTEEPTAERPRWRTVDAAGAPVAEAVLTLAEDRFGAIYAGTLTGVDRLDPATGRIQHFDTASGLSNNLVGGSVATPDGDIWFSTGDGVSRYRPSAAPAESPPAVFIDRVTIDGEDLSVPLRGATAVTGISLPSRTGIVDIGFAAVELSPGSRSDFEFTADLDGGAWTSTGDRRSVRLVGPGAGRRTIAIRARQPNGASGPEARVELEIAIPVWRRWWFLTALVALAAAGAWTVQLRRMIRLQELHRVRSRIAADLHDEMGLSLARVAILADVAGRTAAKPETAETLAEIGSTARDLVDATSDLAWALDPRHDSVAALITRLRRTASEVAEGSGARFVLESDPLDGVPMGSEDRRHLLLILKEAIRNACRHGRPHELRLSIRREPAHLVLALVDDGVGFDPAAPCDGQGLASMRRRAEAMGAELVIDSAPGDGSRVGLRVQLRNDA
ncbi:MAG TPA: two-component regulator propeller domain-containing protein [Candidatus Sulfomarinibacteraceae bacterium]|nr:two-component regulator propeller domain-containing protein [Candidatus Sulfomarinibacteraceae bacterium]